MKIQDRIRALLNRTLASPSPGAVSISAVIDKALGQAGLLTDRKVRPTGESSAVVDTVAPRADASGSRWLARTFSSPGGSRDYKLYVPSTYSTTQTPRPLLLVMLHGCHQSADDTAAGTRMNAWAEKYGFLVAYPQQAERANGSRCWNWFSPDDQERGRGEPALIAGIVSEVSAEFKSDRSRTFVAGLSAGGATAVIMGATYPELFAAVGVHSGLPFRAAHDVASAFSVMRSGEGPHAQRSIGPALTRPTIVFHGDRDTTVNVRNGEAIVSHVLASRGSEPIIVRSNDGQREGRRFSCTVYADERHRDFLEMWIIHEGGHAWSGGSPAGSHTDATGPDASAEMVRFFLSC